MWFRSLYSRWKFGASHLHPRFSKTHLSSFPIHHRTMAACTECLVVGHRGFKGQYPENTLGGFEKCFETGATIFETDVWTTKDEVLVISHDVSTKRVFVDEDGNETDYYILDTNYDEIKNLRTIGSNETLLTFRHLAKWFYQTVQKYGRESEHKIMLDIKKLNPTKLLKLLIEDLLAVHDDLSWWLPRLQLGIWDIRFIKYLNQDEYFQKKFSSLKPSHGYKHFDIVHISFSWRDSLFYLSYNDYLDTVRDSRFKFKVTAVSLIYISTWSTEFLTKFLPVAKAHDIKLFSWTINTRPQLEYFAALGHNARLREYGVITDYPDRMVEDIKAVEQSAEGKSEEETLLGSAPVYVPFSFRLSNWFFNLVVGLFNFRKPQVPQPVPFSTRVDPDERPKFTVSKLWIKVFSTCQHYGIF